MGFVKSSKQVPLPEETTNTNTVFLPPNRTRETQARGCCNIWSIAPNIRRLSPLETRSILSSNLRSWEIVDWDTVVLACFGETDVVRPRVRLPWVPEVSRSRKAGAEITGGGGLVAEPKRETSLPPPVISDPALRERETSGTQGSVRPASNAIIPSRCFYAIFALLSCNTTDVTSGSLAARICPTQRSTFKRNFDAEKLESMQINGKNLLFSSRTIEKR